MGYYFRNKFSERDGVFPRLKMGNANYFPHRKVSIRKKLKRLPKNHTLDK